MANSEKWNAARTARYIPKERWLLRRPTRTHSPAPTTTTSGTVQNTIPYGNSVCVYTEFQKSINTISKQSFYA